MSNRDRLAFSLLVEALLSTRDRTTLLFETEVQALLSMILREETLPNDEVAAHLSRMIRKNLISKGETIQAIEDAVQTLIADQQTARAEILRDIKRKVIEVTCP